MPSRVVVPAAGQRSDVTRASPVTESAKTAGTMAVLEAVPCGGSNRTQRHADVPGVVTVQPDYDGCKYKYGRRTTTVAAGRPIATWSRRAGRLSDYV